MKPIAELRKEKDNLSRYIDRCNYYISLVKQRLLEIGRDYRQGRLTRGEYHDKVNTGLDGKSFRYYLGLYSDLIGRYKGKIRHIEKEIKSKGNNGKIISAFIVLVLISSAFLINQGDITGRVIFSMAESDVDFIDIDISESRNITWQLSGRGRLSTISLTGEYYGESALNIYLDIGENSKLIYRAENSQKFVEECGSACYLYEAPQDEYQLRVEMPKGSRLKISKINYVVSELKEFNIEPSNITIDLEDRRFIKKEFGIFNPRNRNFSVAIYAEGELTDYTTLYSSYEEFNENEPVKYIDYEIDVPFKIEPGSYKEKIVVRYLPAGKFEGEAPVEEYDIIVNVLPSELELLSPMKFNYAYLLGVLLLLVILGNLFFIFRKKGK
ncbi:MAG: hypothetical protein KAK00_08415, partial [Nanoarchaeota archaeon]|nr:hypothetical protein [Nanoarchaeota archaeon]